MRFSFFTGLVAIALFLFVGCTETEFFASLSKDRNGAYPSADSGRFKVGKPYNVAGRTYYPEESYSYTETGIASWYGPGFHGSKTASGERYNENELTAAHRTLQMPSLVRVTNLENGKSVVVRVNDRGPFARGRVIDVSKRAANLLGFIGRGTARVKLEVLPQESLYMKDLASRGVDTRGMEVAVNQGRSILPAQAAPQAYPGSLPEQARLTTPGPYPEGSTIGLQTASLPAPASPQPVPGHFTNGQFYPDPIVTQSAVKSTTLFVQTGAFAQPENARKMANALARYGPASVNPVYMNAQTLYRVRLGPYQDLAQADSLLSNIVAGGYKDARIIVDEGI